MAGSVGWVPNSMDLEGSLLTPGPGLCHVDAEHLLFNV